MLANNTISGAIANSLATRPQCHWTDYSIRMLLLCCVLALALCGLLERELGRLGVGGSIPALLQDLAAIRELDVVCPAQKRGAEPVVGTTLTQMTGRQESLCELPQITSYGV